MTQQHDMILTSLPSSSDISSTLSSTLTDSVVRNLEPVCILISKYSNIAFYEGQVGGFSKTLLKRRHLGWLAAEVCLMWMVSVSRLSSWWWRVSASSSLSSWSPSSSSSILTSPLLRTEAETIILNLGIFAACLSFQESWQLKTT